MSLLQLEQKIRKHCPELQELTKGCRVFVPDALENEEGEPISFWATYLGKTNHTECDVLLEDVYTDDLPEGEHNMVMNYEIKKLDIIGHPIYLEHILRAIEKSNKKPLFPLLMSMHGQILVWNNGIPDVLNIKFNLSLPLSQQSPETIKFINELID